MGVRVYVNGAFYTGVSVDTAELLVADYEQCQRAICERLNSGTDRRWQFPRVRSDAPLRFSISGRQASLIPTCFVERGGPTVTRDLHEYVRLHRQSNADPDAVMSMSEVRIQIFDAGFGVFSAFLDLEVDAADGTLRAIVERETPTLIEPINSLIRSNIEAFCAEAAPLFRSPSTPVPWLHDDGSRSSSASTPMPHVEATASARLLWLHRTYLLEAHDPAATAAAEALLPGIFTTQRFSGFTLLAGVGSSALVCSAGWDDDYGLLRTDDVLTIMDLQWGYIAALMEIDRTLFRRLSRFSVVSESSSALELEKESADVLALYDRVRLFRSTVGSILIDLGGGSRVVWDVMASAQSLPSISEAVDEKLSALRESCETMLTRAATRRQRRIAWTVDIFAGFSVLASVAGTGTFLTDSGVAVSDTVRVLVLALALAVVVIALGVNRLRENTPRSRLRGGPGARIRRRDVEGSSEAAR